MEQSKGLSFKSTFGVTLILSIIVTCILRAIKDLCVRRFSVKKIQQYTRVTLSFASDGSTIASLAQTLQEVVNSGTLTQEQADETVAKKMRELEPKITKVWPFVLIL